MKGELKKVGVGQPQWLWLNVFGDLVRDAFPGADPYLVGTAAESKEWRDVDVRVMLSPREWRRLVGDPERTKGKEGEQWRAMHEESLTNGFPSGSRRAALEMAFAELGKRITGLPIDFQFQTRQHARDYDGRPRVAIGLRVVEFPR